MAYTQRHAVNVGRWWKFSRYKLRGGYICPAPGARLIQYDAWAPKRRPLESLLSLIRGMDYELQGTLVPSATGHGEVVMPTMSQSAVDDVLKWCAHYGLLGLLLQQTRAVILAPRWVRTRRMNNLPKKWKCAQIKMYVRRSGTWFVGGSEGGHRDDVAEGDLVPQADRSSSWPKPGCYVDTDFPLGNSSHHGVSALRTIPLRETWAHFMLDMPSVDPESYDYPEPYSRTFWRGYGESMIDFLGAAQTLGRAMSALEVRTAKPGAQVPPDTVRARGARLLQDFLLGSSPYFFEDEDGLFRYVYRSPSLLGMMTMMAGEDLATGGLMKRCDNTRCQTTFATTSRRTRYCSTKCRAANEQARYREHQRERITVTIDAALSADLPAGPRSRIARSLARKYQTAQSLGEASHADPDTVVAIIARHAPDLAHRRTQRAVRALRDLAT